MNLPHIGLDGSTSLSLNGSRKAYGNSRPHGMTLIEIMVALVIVGILMSAAVIGVGALTGTKAKAAAAVLAGTIRSLYDTASLTGHTCRLSLCHARRKGWRQAFQYWAECASGNLTASSDRDGQLHTDTLRALEAAKHKGAKIQPSGSSYQDIMLQEKERVQNQARFAGFTSPEIKPQKIPNVALSVWTFHQKTAAVSTGLAYLYFFPQGFSGTSPNLLPARKQYLDCDRLLVDRQDHRRGRRAGDSKDMNARNPTRELHALEDLVIALAILGMSLMVASSGSIQEPWRCTPIPSGCPWPRCSARTVEDGRPAAKSCTTRDFNLDAPG